MAVSLWVDPCLCHQVLATLALSGIDNCQTSVLFDRTKITSLDPSLATVLAPYASEPLPAFLKPPIERASG
jgi:hypothetical protein